MRLNDDEMELWNHSVSKANRMSHEQLVGRIEGASNDGMMMK